MKTDSSDNSIQTGNLYLEKGNTDADCRKSMAQLLVPAPSTDLKKQLALVFLDIRNFTGLMESNPGDQVISVLRRLFMVFNESIKKHGGRVIETAGDSLYVVFGLKTPIKEAVTQRI